MTAATTAVAAATRALARAAKDAPPSAETQLVRAHRLTRVLFDALGEDATHGYEHARRVERRAAVALAAAAPARRVHADQALAVRMAALLHDVDDSKLFPAHCADENARLILGASGRVGAHADFDMLVIRMISLVSFSKNGISDWDAEARQRVPWWQLVPRDADRLEALGTMGLARAYSYGCQIGRPLVRAETPRLATRADVLREVHVRYARRDSPNTSTLDCIISNIVMRAHMASGIALLERSARAALAPLVDACLVYGARGTFGVDDLLELVRDDAEAVRLVHAHAPHVDGCARPLTG